MYNSVIYHHDIIVSLFFHFICHSWLIDCLDMTMLRNCEAQYFESNIYNVVR